MRYPTLFLFVIFNLIVHRHAIAQSDTSQVDSVEALIIHYSEVNNNDPTLLDYLTIITEDHVVVIEKRRYSTPVIIQRRIYPFNSDWHIYQLGKGDPSLQKNERLYPVQLDLQDTKEIAGHICTAAKYATRNNSLVAYYTDVHGIKFSTTANYPGIALYYEKEMKYGVSKYQADWMKKGKIHKKLLADLHIHLQTSEGKLIKASQILTQTDKKITPISTYFSRGNWDYKIDYTKSNGERVYAQDLCGNIVFGVFAKTIEQSRKTVLPLFKKILAEFPNQPIKFILFTEEKKKDIDLYAKLDFPLPIDIIPSGQKYLRKLRFHKSTKSIIIDRAANIRYFFPEKSNNLESVVEGLETCVNTQYYHGYLNPMTQ